MAAGLGFKTFNAGDILSASDTNGYLMQGVLVFASAAARDAAITSPQEGQFAYLKDTNVTTYYTGSAWANLDTTGMVNPMTTTGDTIYSSSGSTPARLGIGSTGNVLTVSGGVPVWSAPAGGGGMTLLSTTTLSGASTTISSISQDYVNLYAIITNVRLTGGAVSYRFRCAPNGTTNITSGTTITAGTVNETTSDYLFLTTTVQGNQVNEQIFELANYASTTAFKPFRVDGLVWTNVQKGNLVSGAIESTTAITSLVFSPSTDTFTSGTVKLYGVK